MQALPHLFNSSHTCKSVSIYGNYMWELALKSDDYVFFQVYNLSSHISKCVCVCVCERVTACTFA